ncbi:MAG: iron chaperone [Candidatus Hodarchaeota archaeon]
MSKPKKKFETMDEYIGTFPKEIQEILEKLRQTIRKAAPEAEETINYQIPTFKLNGNLVHFAAYKNHIGFYPTPSGIEAFKEDLSPYEVAKGSIKFSIKKSIPYNLVRKIVEYRVKENKNKKSQINK